MNLGTFKEAFCDKFKCSPADFEDKVFWRCLYRHAIPVAFALRKLNPGFFREDSTLIRQVGLDRDLREVKASLSDFQYVNHIVSHWLRTGLRIRLCARRVRTLAANVFTL